MLIIQDWRRLQGLNHCGDVHNVVDALHLENIRVVDLENSKFLCQEIEPFTCSDKNNIDYLLISIN